MNEQPDLKMLTTAYKAFFEESEAGRYFVSQMNKLIDLNHELAEQKPENSRDHTQRAKGNREALTHIQIILAGTKKEEGKSRGLAKWLPSKKV